MGELQYFHEYNLFSLLSPASLTVQEAGRVYFLLQMNFHALKEGGNQNPGMETEKQVKNLVRFVLDNRLDFYNITTYTIFFFYKSPLLPVPHMLITSLLPREK